MFFSISRYSSISSGFPFLVFIIGSRLISTIRSILTNEKYKGDAIWQKQYTSDFLQKTVKENKGEIPKYYVEEHHKAIIQPEQFDYIQAEIERRKNGTSEISGAEGEPFHAP